MCFVWLLRLFFSHPQDFAVLELKEWIRDIEKIATPPQPVFYSLLNPSPETFVIEFCGRDMSEHARRQHKYGASNVRVVIGVKGFILSPPPTCTATRR